MKKILICFIYVYLFFNTNANSDTPLKWNQTYSGGEITINEIKFDLPEGEWLLLSKKGFMIRTIRNTAVLFVKEENGILKELKVYLKLKMKKKSCFQVKINLKD